MNIKNMLITQIIPYARNPRKNDSAITRVAASIKEFGFQSPIIIDKENVIIAGHTRYLAAQQLGLKEVPVKIAENLTPSQVKAYRIADNRVGEFSSWDNELLKLEFDELLEDNVDLNLTGFDNDSIKNLDIYDDESIDTNKEKEFSNKFEVVVECEDEADQQAIYKLMTSKGYKCKVLSM